MNSQTFCHPILNKCCNKLSASRKNELQNAPPVIEIKKLKKYPQTATSPKSSLKRSPRFQETPSSIKKESSLKNLRSQIKSHDTQFSFYWEKKSHLKKHQNKTNHLQMFKPEMMVNLGVDKKVVKKVGLQEKNKVFYQPLKFREHKKTFSANTYATQSPISLGSSLKTVESRELNQQNEVSIFEESKYLLMDIVRPDSAISSLKEPIVYMNRKPSYNLIYK